MQRLNKQDNYPVYYDGLAAHIILQSAICSKDLNDGTEKDFIQCHICSIMSNACKVLRNRFYLLHNLKKDEISNKKSASMNMLGYVLGQVCTLNCKHCCEKTPYFPVSNKTQVPAGEVIKDIHQVVNACEFLTILEFVGGEPFLHKELFLILKDALNLNNVGFINVFTNGTVKPSDKLCEVLNDRRITVYISNYSKTLSVEHAEKVNATEEMLIKYNVHYLYGTAKSWQEFLSFDFVDYEEQELRKRFINCFLHSCNRLHRGILYHCPHQYAGAVLNKIPDDCDTVKIYENNLSSLVEKLDKFRKADCINACKYCALPFDAPMVTAGIQLDKVN